MVRKLALIVLALMLATLSLGCTPGATSGTPSTEDSDQTMPDDFYIIYETHGASDVPPSFSPEKLVTLLNTKDNVAGTYGYWYNGSEWIFGDGWFLSRYYIPHEDLRDIYSAIIDYDIKSYSSPDVLTGDGFEDFLVAYYRITFCANGVIYQITFSPLALIFPSGNKLDAFQRVLEEKSANGRPRPS